MSTRLYPTGRARMGPRFRLVKSRRINSQQKGSRACVPKKVCACREMPYLADTHSKTQLMLMSKDARRLVVRPSRSRSQCKECKE